MALETHLILQEIVHTAVQESRQDNHVILYFGTDNLVTETIPFVNLKKLLNSFRQKSKLI